jgi:hypothetical protein
VLDSADVPRPYVTEPRAAASSSQRIPASPAAAIVEPPPAAPAPVLAPAVRLTPPRAMAAASAPVDPTPEIPSEPAFVASLRPAPAPAPAPAQIVEPVPEAMTTQRGFATRTKEPTIELMKVDIESEVDLVSGKTVQQEAVQPPPEEDPLLPGTMVMGAPPATRPQTQAPQQDDLRDDLTPPRGTPAVPAGSMTPPRRRRPPPAPQK